MIHFANKVPSSQSYGFSSSHVWVWELDNKESWAPKNWCFWTVVMEKTLESPLDCKEIQPVHLKGNQSFQIFIWKTDAKAEAPIIWPPDAKSQFTGKEADAGKDWGQEKREQQRMRYQLNGHEFEQTLGADERQGSLVCCRPWGHHESDTTWWLNKN